jgi:hypothetical protein
MASTSVFAADCKWKTERTACPGKEEEAFKPYAGKHQTDEEDKKAADEASCLKTVEAFTKIVRKGTLTAKKSTHITFKGKDTGKTFEDKAECK